MGMQGQEKIGKVLVVDDNEDVLQAARLCLKQHMELVHIETNPTRLPDLIKRNDYDVILLDMNFNRDVTSGVEGFSWLNRILELDPNAVVILITAYGDVDMAVRAIKEGATDFVLKPWQNEKLLATIFAALKLRFSRCEIAALKNRQKQLIDDMDQPFHDFIGTSAGMKKVLESIQKVSQTDANVLILGENGTGKELVARALHRYSSQNNETFICVDMGAISESLFESELFGHVKGAFTDAKTERIGRFEIASGGTLFLDEIGNLSLAMQAKILRVLETRQVTPLGTNTPRPITIRLICATNMPIYQMVERGEFRPDLLYRINTVEIQLPPLRQRQEDIPLLANYFLNLYCRKYKKEPKQFSPEALHKLSTYAWPGNVRELQHAIERAVILGNPERLQPEDFFLPGSEAKTMEGENPENEPPLPLKQLNSYNLEEIEKSVIRKTIEACRGNISQAAKELGLTRASLYRRMEKYGI